MKNLESSSQPPRDDNNDALDRLLHESAARSVPIPDNGFSIRVLTALPLARRSHSPSLRTSLCLAGALVGILLSLKSAPLSSSADLASRFAHALLELSGWLIAPAQLALFGTLTLAASILLVFDPRLRRRL